ncbi:MAG: molybdenum cofactor biosynthesis protein MoaE [Sulfobacillus sp.]
MLRLRRLFFAQAAQQAGQSETRWEVAEGSTLATVRQLLSERYGSGFARFGLARNLDWADDSTALQDGDEVAVLPPVSGGGQLITEQPLDPGALIAAVSRPGAGAIALFVGVVRDHFQGTATAACRYQAYPEMAERVLSQILTEAAATDPDLRIVARHRIGELAVGEASLIVAASSPHRQAAFAACRQTVEEIKIRLPVWKQELTAQGAVWHEDGQLPSAAKRSTSESTSPGNTEKV